MGIGTNSTKGWMPVKVVDDLLSSEIRKGRVNVCLDEEQLLDADAFIDIAIQSTIDKPVVILDINVAAQMEQVTFRLFEDADVSSGTPGDCVNINRVTTPELNTIVYTSPVVDDVGTELTPATSGWKLQGYEGPAGSEYVNASINAGGFIARPLTWYILRFINTGTANNRPIQIGVKYIDPSDDE